VTLRLAGDPEGARDQRRQALALALEIRDRMEEGRALAALEIFEELEVPQRHAVAARLDQDG
jgi:hypothetical protein